MATLLRINGDVSAGGRSRFLDSHGGTEPTPKIYVKVSPGDIGIVLLAQLDSGAAWSVLNREIAEALGFIDQTGPSVTLSTRSGTIQGKLIRAPLTIVSRGRGFHRGPSDTLRLPTLDARQFPRVLWLSGRVRFAVDPSTNDFYFSGISER